jgi:hypothetical protein
MAVGAAAVEADHPEQPVAIAKRNHQGRIDGNVGQELPLGRAHRQLVTVKDRDYPAFGKGRCQAGRKTGASDCITGRSGRTPGATHSCVLR